MSRELSVAYARVKKQWPGLVVRQHQPRIKGWPDFILISGITIFAEVKWLDHARQAPVLELMQHHWLTQIAGKGGTSILLCAHDKTGHVLGERGSGWLAWRPPMPKGMCFERSLTSGLELTTPHPFWSGRHLAGLLDYLTSV